MTVASVGVLWEDEGGDTKYSTTVVSEIGEEGWWRVAVETCAGARYQLPTVRRISLLDIRP